MQKINAMIKNRCKKKPYIIYCYAVISSFLLHGCYLPLCVDNQTICEYCTSDNDNDTCSFTSNAYNKSCFLKICKNDQWERVEECKFGFDGSKCLPECVDGQVQCQDENSISVEPNQNIKCDLYTCKNNHWMHIENCGFGFNGDTCLPECKFGYANNNKNNCINPCAIDDVEYNNMNMSNGNIILRCDSEHGWSIDNSCINDFSFKSDEDEKHDIPTMFFSSELKKLYPQTLENFRPGKCGECNSETTPVYCSQQDNTYYIHKCDNGMIDIHKADNGECNIDNYMECNDMLNQMIWVDTKTNRYHCGSCGNTCDDFQKCLEGSCKSTLSVKAEDCHDNFFNFRIGSRLIRAYCIQNENELKQIGHLYPENNFDNAYILVNDIDLQNWEQIDTFSGILYGNGKKLTYYHNQNADYLKLGIFNQIINAYIDNVNIEFKLSKEDATFYSPTPGQSSFGLLANAAKNSTIRYIQLNNANIALNPSDFNEDDSIPMCNSYSFLLGYTNSTQISDITLTNNTLTVGLNVNEAIVGGIVGEAYHTSINNSYVNNAEFIINGYTSVLNGGVGGIVGYGSYNSISNININQFIMNNVDYVGGIAGYVANTQISNVIINTLNVNASSLNFNGAEIGGITGYSENNHIRNTELYNITLNGTGDTGGIIGFDSNNTIVDNVHIKDLKLHFDSSNYNKNVFHALGGLIGSGMHTYFSNIVLDNLTIITNDTLDASNPNSIGGAAGNLDSGKLKNISLNTITLQGNDYVGGLIGFSNSSDIELCHVHNHYIYGKSNVGGLIGHAQSGNMIRGTIAESDSLVTNDNCIGGFIGNITDDLTISASASFCNITSLKNEVAGLIGCSTGKQNIIHLANISSIAEIDTTSHTDEIYSLVAFSEGTFIFDSASYVYASSPNNNSSKTCLSYIHESACNNPLGPWFDNTPESSNWIGLNNINNNNCATGFIDYSPYICFASYYNNDKSCYTYEDYYNKDVCNDHSKNMLDEPCFSNTGIKSYHVFPLWKDSEFVTCHIEAFKNIFCNNANTNQCNYDFLRGEEDSFSLQLPLYVYKDASNAYQTYTVTPSFCEIIDNP